MGRMRQKSAPRINRTGQNKSDILTAGEAGKVSLLARKVLQSELALRTDNLFKFLYNM